MNVNEKKKDSFYKGKNKSKGGSRPRRNNNDKPPRATDGSEVIDDRAIKGYITVGRNDPTWYAANTQLLADAGKYSFNNPLGNLLDIRGNSTENVTYPIDGALNAELKVTATQMALPGIMALKVSPTYGYADTANAPLNIASRHIYTYVRHANSGHANYDSQNLMMYLMAMDNIYMWFNFMQRVYGIVRYYDQKNKYLPAALCTAMHVDYDDVLANLADFRYFINSCAFKIGAMVTPANMNIYRRHAWLFSGVYKDADSAKAQLYTFTPEYVLRFYNVDEDSTGPKLKGITVGNAVIAGNDNTYVTAPLTVAKMKEIFNKLMDPVYSDEDMNIMSGDILKAYGEANVFKIQQVPEDYMVSPVKNMEVLMQIHNAFVPGMPGSTTIQEDDTKAFLVSKPKFDSSTWSSKLARIIDFPWENPTPEDVMTATRFTVMGEADGDKVKFPYIGSDVISRVKIYAYGRGGNGVSSTDEFQLFSSPDMSCGMMLAFSANTNFDPTFLFWIGQVSRFDWAPIFRVYMPKPGGAEGDFVEITEVGDLDNYTTITNDGLSKLHETALLSLFDVPRVGSN